MSSPQPQGGPRREADAVDRWVNSMADWTDERWQLFHLNLAIAALTLIIISISLLLF